MDTRITTIVRNVSPNSVVRFASLVFARSRIRSASSSRSSGASDSRKTVAAMSNASIVPRPSPSGPGSATSATAKMAMKAMKRGGAIHLPRLSLNGLAMRNR